MLWLSSSCVSVVLWCVRVVLSYDRVVLLCVRVVLTDVYVDWSKHPLFIHGSSSLGTVVCKLFCVFLALYSGGSGL